ncbi:MAG TPA: gliding-motility protein MglA, partial [Acidobacteria bacterium]|nr:gliding-motility protein MglA [Acidobacteriota bacterium]
MVFFNYSTMQMAAKVVYYGPGLCGKTTNLHYIYAHTAGGSRGEMVSLETETDRTLFFDLLPIDVGTIAGFNTRIQLYTVPGQVFYNTTRKLVLKGVDGVVFVADSQRPMIQANIESFRNLEENLAEAGLSLESLPLVIQLNKRDLPDICTVEEMHQALNRGNWPCVEASAFTGVGVFETLKEISKVTLLALKKRLARGSDAPATRPAPPRP